MIPFELAEQRVTNFYRHRATVSDIGDAFAYMNCIKVVDYITGPAAFNNRPDIEPSFVVTEIMIALNYTKLLNGVMLMIILRIFYKMDYKMILNVYIAFWKGSYNNN